MMTSPGAADPPTGGGSQDLLMVDGMFCGACAASLESRLAALPGVSEAAVDLAAGAALLVWRPGRADPEAACRVVDALGYSARRPGVAGETVGAPGPEKGLQLRLAIALFFGMWTMLPSIILYLDAAPSAAMAHGFAWAAAVASLPVIAYAGRPFYAMALSTLRGGAAGIDALVTIGVLGAVCLSAMSLAKGGAEVYFEVAVALITLQLLARLIELKVVRAGRDAVARLLDLTPPRVVRLDPTAGAGVVAVSDIGAGDIILAEPGDTLAVDGVVEHAAVRVDRHLLTGESEAVLVAPGETVCAGEVVIEGPLRLRVTGAAGERRVDRISRQVRALLMRKPGWQLGIDAVARHFLLLAALAAALGAVVAALSGVAPVAIAERALAVFVIACPCALSLAAPLAGLGATRRAAEAGFLLRDLRAVSRVGRVDILFVDKTGTLTEGRPEVRALRPTEGVDASELLEVAARVERESRHPFALAIVEAALGAGIALDGEDSGAPTAGRGLQRHPVTGCGVRMVGGGTILRVGSARWLAEEGLRCPPLGEEAFSRVWVADGDRVLGAVELDDPLRAGVERTIEELQATGMTVVMLSGDGEGPVSRLSARLGIEGIPRCSPEDKVARLEAAEAQGLTTAFIGDGLNDGPAIAAAELGIAVDGALDAARTASAVTLLRGGVERVTELLGLIESARRVLRQNIAGAVVYNALAVPAALAGWVHPGIAAAAMALSSITVVLNSLRAGVVAGSAPRAGGDARGGRVDGVARRGQQLAG